MAGSELDMTQIQHPDAAAAPEPSAATASEDTRTRIGNRYRILGELGRGGMSQVYRVVDENDGREMALKLLQPPQDATLGTRITLLFEREFHTLSQLRHPRVIEVYDYGRGDAGPYYTMELLDGGDLRERSPVPWRDACRLAFDVCSSLALLHSRRLLHCDISPRNVRCTRDEQAKLIDFGAMAAMGPARQVVGTPAFIAPEMVHRSTLDARTDLFSLGATLYFTLTGRTPFRALTLVDVQRAWAERPAPPSSFAPDVPPDLDALVTSLLSLEPGLRPRSAFDVMQRLTGIAGLQGTEPLSVSQAYLATPMMVGRDAQLFTFRTRMNRALAERGGGLLIEAPGGFGRSRVLDACVLEAKTLGATVIRARATGARTVPLSAAAVLAEQLRATLPEVSILAARSLGVFDRLFEPETPGEGGQRAQLKRLAGAAELLPLQEALSRWILRVSETQPLLIAVDDVDGLDEPSIGLLAALAHHGRRNRLLVIGASKPGVPSAAFRVFASYCGQLGLRALESAETEALFISIFDDVPNVRMLSSRIHAVAGGRPRECMALAQHLLDIGKLEYKSGAWTLPEVLTTKELPASVREMLRARLSGLPPLARALAELQALSIAEALTEADYSALLPESSQEQLDEALMRLVKQEVLSTDGYCYVLSNDELHAELDAELDDATRRKHHETLAALFERTGRPGLYCVHHLLLAGKGDAALDRLFPILRATDWTMLLATAQMSPAEVAQCVARALDVAEQQQRSAREVNDLRCTLMLLSATADNALYWRTAPPLLVQLKHDSGYDVWRELTDIADPLQRTLQALQRVGQRYEATPERERVYRPDEAVKLLVSYAVSSIPAGVRSYDVGLLYSLPGLLEPFAPLAPLLGAMWQNTIATQESSCDNKHEPARLRWIQIYEGLANVTPAELPGVAVLRAAMAYGIGLTEAHIGIETAAKWADILERDDLQRVTALYLRKTILLQSGDFEGADRARRQAELLAAQVPGRQPFVTLNLELAAHAIAQDLRGVKQVADRILPLAQQYPGWQPWAELAQGLMHRLRGDLGAACTTFERGITLSQPDPAFRDRPIAAWPMLAAAYVEVLTALGRFGEAKSFGERAAETCTALGIQLGARDLQCSLALAEAKLGDHAGAAARLDRLIEQQREFGVVGLSIGVSYEARTRVAICARDVGAAERFAALTAHEFRHGLGSPLGARYERLMREAQAVGIEAPQLAEFENTVQVGATEHRTQAERSVVESMQSAGSTEARAACALGLLCDAHAAAGGHLFLIENDRLRCAASHKTNPPDARLLELVQGFWNSQCEEAPTVLAEDAKDSAQTAFWIDERGATCRPVLLHCHLHGELVYAGVAVLASGMQLPSNNNVPLPTWIAMQLIHAGDTPGMRAA